MTYSQIFGSGLNIANLIMADLKKEMGITVSIGISYNKIFSKLASDIHKPDAITQIPYKYYREFVHKLPVEMLLFVGDKTKELFYVYGIKTIGDLAFADINIVKKVVGEKNALKLIHFANGYEFTPVKLYGEKDVPKSISRAETTYKDITTYGDLRVLIERLSEDVAKRLRNEKMKAGAICLKLRDRAYNEKSIQKQLTSYIDNGTLLSEELCDLFLDKHTEKRMK